MSQPVQPFPMNISVDEARSALSALLPAPEVITVPLVEAYGLRLAADLVARVDHPSATVSALDGIACRAADTLTACETQPVALKLVGESRAGLAFGGTVKAGEAIYIYTGAPLPTGTDAICPVEQLNIAGDKVYLRRCAFITDVRQRGEDFGAGETVLQMGQRLTPARVALAAALGYEQVPVMRPLRVAVLATGDEVIEPPTPLAAGQVYNSNTYGLIGMLREAGCEAIKLDSVPDSLEALQSQLAALGHVDLLLTSGGVSMGKYDFVRDLLHQQGEVSFWKVRMRPGGPVMAGRWGEVAVVGLPGNPVSSLVAFQVLLIPVLTGEKSRRVRVQTSQTLRGVAGKAAFWRGQLENTHTGSQVRLYHAQSSGVLRSLSEAGVLICLDEGQTVEAGDWVDIIML